MINPNAVLEHSVDKTKNVAYYGEKQRSNK